jgi:nucleolar protein 16
MVQEPSLLSPATNMADDVSCIPSGFGRILRDATGNIIGFEASKTEESSLEVVEVEGLQLDVKVDQAVHQRWAGTLSSSDMAQIDPKGKRVLRGELIYQCSVNLDFSSSNPILANYLF